ncbi:MAG: sugar phosphate isomerase/epimerase [Verrucomicrobiales bacterium]|nr:sugar phosphate isomerase/epimerase [Verrucomicrobiales bacterium]
MKKNTTSRRQFLNLGVQSLGAAAFGFSTACKPKTPEIVVPEGPLFQISLAEWSLHKALKSGELDHLNFPKYTKDNFGITALEHVNQFFSEKKDKWGLQPKNRVYLLDLKKRTDDLGMDNVLIMCDGVGKLGDSNTARRKNAVEGHYAWVEAAKLIGCHSIRVNAASDHKLSPEEQASLCADGLRSLCDFAKQHGIGVIVENHGGLSSDGAWLASVISKTGRNNAGTLPDFGNFYIVKNRGSNKKYEEAKKLYAQDAAYHENEGGLEYDRYLGIKDLMPFAKGVSAKSHDFDDQGEEIHTDFHKAMKIVKDSGYRGYVGIEYEGDKLSEPDGIKATQALLKKTFAELG